LQWATVHDHINRGRNAGSVHTPGSGSFFGGNSQPIAEKLTPKNVPDPVSFQGKQHPSRKRLRTAQVGNTATPPSHGCPRVRLLTTYASNETVVRPSTQPILSSCRLAIALTPHTDCASPVRVPQPVKRCAPTEYRPMAMWTSRSQPTLPRLLMQGEISCGVQSGFVPTSPRRV